MAITILSSPNQFMAAYNQVAYTVSSNNTAQPNFNFIIDVNQTSGISNPLARLKYPKQPNSSTLTFDIGSVLKNYVSYDFKAAMEDVCTANDNSQLKYFLQFRELYDVSGIPTLSGVLASNPTTPSTTSYQMAGNAIFDFEDFTPTSYAGVEVATHGFLNTSLPEKIEPNQNKILTFLRNATMFDTVRITSGGVNYDEPIYTPITNKHLFNINAGDLLLLIQGVVVVNNTYTVSLVNLGTVICSKVFTYETPCSQYPTVRLHWLNKLGGFDSFNFEKNTVNATEIERKQFKAPLPIGYSTSDRLKTNYNTTVNDVITINSDWISAEQSLLFEELSNSPVIYLERSSDDFVAVNILNSSYEIKTFLTDRKMFNVTFEIEYSYSRYRQSL
jgi:hypothetical protein